MAKQFKKIPDSITAPTGFVASSVFCDIKRLGTGKGSNKGKKRDLALIVSEVPAVAAGMFTTNQVCAAPVKVCVERTRSGEGQAIVVNSGNANACTGKQGMADAREMTAILGEQLHMPERHILVASTGRIGVNLPMENVKRGIIDAAWQMNSTVANADAVVAAIMTSDTREKKIAIELPLGGKVVRIGGICKGAGMIQPGMSASGKRPAAAPALHATMLCFITTDVAIEARALQACLQEAVAQSFNRTTVDGDMSTNDTVLVLANALAENPTLRRGSKDLAAFQAGLNHVCLELAKMVVRDGEG